MPTISSGNGRLARVSLDYHVEVDGFFYSVPHGLIREQVDVRATTRAIELFHRGVRVAAHQRRYGGRRHGTDPDHMPSAHRRYAEWTPERFRRWGRSIGPNTEGLVLAILANRPHPEQGFRTCLGVLRLFKDIDPERAELIAARAVAVSALTYKSIASIIANKLERSSRDTEDAIIEHPNLRGDRYARVPGLGGDGVLHPERDAGCECLAESSPIGEQGLKELEMNAVDDVVAFVRQIHSNKSSQKSDHAIPLE
jgi:hypothetical protein